MMGSERACKTVYSKGKLPKNVKDCLIKGGVGAAGAIVVGRVNKEIATRLAKQTVVAGATACVAAVTP